jgi:hypothetical protein
VVAARFQGSRRPEDRAEMDRIAAAREESQPLRSRPAARPSRTRLAARPGNWSTRPAAAACADRRRAGQREAHQLPDQHRRMPPAPTSRARRGSPPPGGQFREIQAWRSNGKSSGSEWRSVIVQEVEQTPRRRPDGRLVERARGLADERRGRGRGARIARPPGHPLDMDRDVAQRLAEAAPDVVFNALHGVPARTARCRACWT